MALAPAITEIEQLKSHPALARLLEWNTLAGQGRPVRPRRTHTVGRKGIDSRGLRDPSRQSALSVQLSLAMSPPWTGFPSQPRFEVVYHLLSLPKKERVRIKARLEDASP